VSSCSLKGRWSSSKDDLFHSLNYYYPIDVSIYMICCVEEIEFIEFSPFYSGVARIFWRGDFKIFFSKTLVNWRIFSVKRGLWPPIPSSDYAWLCRNFLKKCLFLLLWYSLLGKILLKNFLSQVETFLWGFESKNQFFSAQESWFTWVKSKNRHENN